MKKALDTIKLRALKIQENSKNIFLSRTSPNLLDFKFFVNYLENINPNEPFLGRKKLVFNFEKLRTNDDLNIKILANRKLKEKLMSLNSSFERNKEIQNENKNRERIYNTFYKLKVESQKLFLSTGSNGLYFALKIFESADIADKIIRAPLLFFPANINISRKSKKVEIQISDIIEHNTALLSMISNRKNIFIDDFNFNFSYDFNKKDLMNKKILSELNSIYKKLGVNLSNKLGGWTKLTNVKKFNNFSKSNFKVSENRVEENIVFGIFSKNESYVFNDLKRILGNEEWINQLINLGKNIDRTFSVEKYLNDFNEKDTLLFSNLDLYQQGATKLALEKDVVLIQGPPGTGKTQTILNIVLNAISNNKKVLIVSEKQVALDVIYKRLNNSVLDLRPFAFNFSLKNNRKDFFGQLKLLDKFLEKEILTKGKARINYENQYKLIKEIDGIKYKKIEKYTYKDLMNFLLTNKGNPLLKYYGLFKKYLNEGKINELFDQEWVSKYSDLMSWQKKLRFDLSIDKISWIMKLDKKGLETSIRNYINFGLWQRPNEVKKVKKFKLSTNAVYDDVITTIREYKRMGGSNFHYDKYQPKQIELMWEIYKNNISLKNKEKIIDFYRMYELMPKFEESLMNFVDSTIQLNNSLNKITKIKDKVIKNNIKDLYNNKRRQAIKFYNYGGNKEKINRLIKDSYKSDLPRPSFWVKKNWKILSNMFNIFIGTIEDVSEFIPLTQKYDYLIFDEASQIFFEKALPSIYRGNKIIVLGDQKQLKPSNFFTSRNDLIGDEELNDDSRDLLEAESILDFYNENTKHNIMLRGHYRSKFGDLIKFSNDEFYNGKLWFENSAETFDDPIDYINVKGTWENNANEAEANEVVKQIIKFVENDKFYMKKSIGVVTFNVKQKEMIEDKIFSLGHERINNLFDWKGKEGEDLSIFVKNIEDIQGEERDYIIFSIAYSNNVRNYGSISLPGGENRINVAITRAKEKVLVIKSHKASEYYGLMSKANGPKVFVKYLIFVENIVEKNKNRFSDETSTITLDQKRMIQNYFVNDVHKYLAGKIGVNYRIGKYPGEKTNINVDLVVYKDKTPIMALICNDEEVDTPFSMMEKYIFKEEFLSSRGWKVYRINKYSWFSNKEQFLLEIKKFIEEK